MNPDIQLDQTQFVAESPLLEEVETVQVPDQPLPAAELEQLKQKKIKKVIIGVVVFLFIALIVFAFIKSRSVENNEKFTEAEETKLTEVVTGPFTQRLSELKNELEIADPNQEDLPFPPIDFMISLEN